MQAQHRKRHFLLPLGILLLAWGAAEAGDWPRFRGPNGSGIATDKDVPVKWKADNILWKTPLSGVGHSSPVVSRGRVFLQLSSEDGAERWLLCLDAMNGKLLWKRGVTAKKAHTHPLNSLASSTPALCADKVFAVYWDGKDMHLSAYDFKGERRWDKNLGAFKSQHGVGHSPMLVDDKVIVANDQDGSAHLLAFHARTGEKAWETERKPFRACYSTPFLHVQPGGAKELIVASTAGVTGYNPADGKPNWWYTWSFPGMPPAHGCLTDRGQWSGLHQLRRRLRRAPSLRRQAWRQGRHHRQESGLGECQTPLWSLRAVPFGQGRSSLQRERLWVGRLS